MPHDKNGVELRIDDIVAVYCKVHHIVGTTDEGTNVVLETLEEHYPTNSYSTVMLNGKQMQKVGNAVGEEIK